PASVLVLHAIEVVGDFLIPFQPILVTLDHQSLANVQVAQKLLATIGAKTLNEAGIFEILDRRLDGHLTRFIYLRDSLYFTLGIVLIVFRGLLIGEHFFGGLEALGIGFARLLQGRDLVGDVV